MKKKKISVVILCILIASFFARLYPGTVEEKDENTAVPLNKDAGRIVQLKEIMRFSDDPENPTAYFFKYPRRLKIAPDGSIFVADRKQLLKFDATGKFEKNYYRHGQGPGEMLYLSNYTFNRSDNTIILHDNGQNKIIIMDMKGNLVREFKYRPRGRKIFIKAYDKHYFFFEKKPADTKGKLKIYEIPMSLVSVSADGNEIADRFQFPLRYMILKSGDRSFTTPRARLIVRSLEPHFLIISHTPEYQIKWFSLKENRVILRFNREYRRIEVTPETREYAHGGNYDKISIGGQFHKVPVAKYLDDIQTFFRIQDRLWVVTSTVDKTKGILVDVFDREGKYIDNFYLKYPEYVEPYRAARWLSTVHNEFIFAIEEIEGEWFLVKYKVET
ncbi:MAG: 6-bladed beta-propeller [Candidatus Aminicenantes bacterium]|nr:6-bladed beta-propeller [Candidatus Aminicenantes bacterium]NIM82873.1 6-bladed beta-propeller [Candidatus Aminicenantes bacterium]NIN22249.1 6-bladed beta-propeller [Candidatus Aminicenantes bacterium]NIN46017.1 6-bladed beta-propeller [Candidatus Aminicenantes bacterium]NIN88853.1 6-bladed beta-propeller [Candidatus Aminicenantes bacterium]